MQHIEIPLSTLMVLLMRATNNNHHPETILNIQQNGTAFKVYSTTPEQLEQQLVAYTNQHLYPKGAEPNQS